MTTLNEVANLNWNSGMVSPSRAVVGSGIVTWLTTAIHRIWDIINVDLGQADVADADYYPAGGCCSF